MKIKYCKKARLKNLLLLFCILILLLSNVLSDSPHKVFIDYTENTEFILEHVGNDIKLQCNLNGLVDDKELTDVKVQWYFKQCSNSLETDMRNCETAYARDWLKLPCEQQFCQQNLLLRNVTEKYSGFYKCIVHPDHLDEPHKLDIQLVRTFQLDIKDNSLVLPQFLDNTPQNSSVYEREQVVFQCRVRSEEHPTIRWFKRYTNETEITEGVQKGAHTVKYNGFKYRLLNTAREKLIAENIFLSKLILNKVNLEDAGFYACVAISYRGYNMHEAYLEVKLQDWTNDGVEELSTSTDKSEFWLLFLMPVGLAMLPLSFWLFYCIYKRCNTNNHIRKLSLQCSDEETGGEHYILNS